MKYKVTSSLWLMIVHSCEIAFQLQIRHCGSSSGESYLISPPHDHRTQYLQQRFSPEQKPQVGKQGSESNELSILQPISKRKVLRKRESTKELVYSFNFLGLDFSTKCFHHLFISCLLISVVSLGRDNHIHPARILQF